MDLRNPLSMGRALSTFPRKRLPAKCLLTDNLYDCVYIRDDPDPSGKYSVERADPSDSSKMPAAGIIIEKATSTDCTVQWIGETSGFSGLTFGKLVYVGASGQITQASGGLTYIQVMGIALSSDTIMLIPSFASSDAISLNRMVLETDGKVVYIGDGDIVLTGA